MKCFFHEQTDAVGLCVNCGRALCRRCAVTVGGRLRCESCYIESELGHEARGLPKAADDRGDRRLVPEVRANSGRLLFRIGMLGSLIGIVVPVASYLLSRGLYSVLLYGLITGMTGVWLSLQSFGFFGLYRSFGEVMGFVAFVFTLITAVITPLQDLLSVIFYIAYYPYMPSYYAYFAPLVYQVVSAIAQACALILVRQSTGKKMLFVLAAIVVVAAACVSLLPMNLPSLSISNAFIALCFFEVSVASHPEAKPEPQVVDPLKELR